MVSRQFAESMSHLHKEMATLKKSNNALSEEVTAVRGHQLKTEEQAVKRKSSAVKRADLSGNQHQPSQLDNGSNSIADQEYIYTKNTLIRCSWSFSIL